MKANSLVTSFKHSINKAGLTLKKHGPELLAVLGVATAGASLVVACIQTTKLEEKTADLNEELDNIKNNDSYDEKERKKAIAKVYFKIVGRCVVLYSSAGILFVGSMASFLGAMKILNDRNAALSAFAASVLSSFNDYRARVVEKYGEEEDFRLLTGAQEETIEKTITDENGKEKKVKEKVEVVDPQNGSPFMKYLTRSNAYWCDDKEYMMMQIRANETVLNDMLKAHGSLVLNQAYHEFGFEPTKAGMVVGWIYDPENPVGDNYVEISVKEVWIPDEYGDLEMAYAIDFNVDGNIYEKLK